MSSIANLKLFIEARIGIQQCETPWFCFITTHQHQITLLTLELVGETNKEMEVVMVILMGIQNMEMKPGGLTLQVSGGQGGGHSW